MEQVLASAEQLANVPTVRALMVVQTLAYGQGDIEAVERYSQQLLQISGELGDAHAEGYARYGLGLVAMSRQNPTTASAYLEAALPLLEQVRDHGMASSAQAFQGRLLLLLGDYEAAIRRFEGGLALARRQGDSLGISIALFNLAQVAQTRGDNETAARRLREGVALSVEMRHHTNLAYFAERLAEVDLARGRPNRSARLLGAADGLLESIGATVYNYYAPDRSRRERVVAEVRQRLGEATFDALWAEGQSMTLEATVAEALEEGERACGEFDGS
jgi:tetratricopeptide (TPR) repeat protein